jgi:hypothetical protein
VEHRDHHERHRLAEVEQLAGLGGVQHGVDVADVGLHDGRVGHRLEQLQRVRDRDRLVVDVHHPAPGIELVRGLVDVADGGNAGAEVEELGDPLLVAEPDRSLQERPVGPADQRRVRVHPEQLLGGGAVGGGVVGAAERVVVDAGRAGNVDVDAGRRPPVGGVRHVNLLEGRRSRGERLTTQCRTSGVSGTGNLAS